MSILFYILHVASVSNIILVVIDKETRQFYYSFFQRCLKGNFHSDNELTTKCWK